MLESSWIQGTIKELLNNIGCLEALRALNVSGCSNLNKFLEI